MRGEKTDIEFLFPVLTKGVNKSICKKNFSVIIRFALGLQASNFKLANINCSQ
jgi:hypothetical protein